MIPGLGNPVDGRLDTSNPQFKPTGTLFITDFVFSNPQGAEGTLSVLRNSTPLLSLQLGQLPGLRPALRHADRPLARRRAQPRGRAARARAPAIRRCSGPGTCGPEVPDPPGRRRRAGPGADPPRADRGAARRGLVGATGRWRGHPAADAGNAAEPALPLPPAPGAPPRGSTTLVSQRAGGGFPDNSSAEPSISADGRYVAFASSGTNLVGGPAGNAPQPAVFVRDRQLGKTRRLPLPAGFPGGGSAREPSISADGNVVAFTYQAPAGFTSVGSIVLAWDRTTGKTEVVSRNTKGTAAGPSREPSVSATGRFVAFTSDNPAIVPPDGDNADVFRYDRRTKQTRAISVGFSGGLTGSTNSAPSISADGNLVAFVSDGGDVIVPTNTGNGTQVYVRDVRAGQTEQVSVAVAGPPNGASGAPAISGDGNAVAFEAAASNITRNDDNAAPDVFLRDRRAGTTVLVSVTPGGQSGGGLSRLPSISVDGRMVAFQSTAPGPRERRRRPPRRAPRGRHPDRP